MYTVNIFCDASVGPTGEGACSGALVETTITAEDGNNKEFTKTKTQFYAVIQTHGTNNSGEIAAIALGISKAIEIYRMAMLTNYGKPCILNVFSDSMISVKGIKEWMPTWIAKYKDGYLRSASNKIVANQYFFKYIYNMIILNPDVKLNIYHQDGHINQDFNQILPSFRKTNGVYPQDIGITAEHLCLCNDMVDKKTRIIINEFLFANNANGYPIDTTIYRDPYSNYNPVLLDTSAQAIAIYKKAIA